ncbi:MAG: hypothetical protein SH850_18340 [Planctomycetaceae bacterium]|nr:hypothetical protein [Planctomycetaceae bacterium]
MSVVADAYRATVDAMTPAQKIARMVQLNQLARWNIERCIAAEQGPLPPEVMKWQVALWIHGRNPVCRRLIEEQLARVRAE